MTLQPGATVPEGDEVDFTLTWQHEAGRLVMFGGAAFTSNSWRMRRHVWSFYPQDALAYFYNVRLYERELLRNVTEREIINFGRSQVVIISGAIVWVGFFLTVFCVCCSCPCFCWYVQSKRRAKEKARNEELVWSQQLELVIQATQRQAQAKERASRLSAKQFDPKSRDVRSSTALKRSSSRR